MNNKQLQVFKRGMYQLGFFLGKAGHLSSGNKFLKMGVLFILSLGSL